MTKNVDIHPLKEAAVKFPEDVKDLILSQDDQIDPIVLISKAKDWERMLRRNGGQK